MISADLPAVLVLDRLCFGKLWTENGYRRELDSPNSDLWVLEIHKNQLQASTLVGVGCVWAILSEAHITLLGISPAYQRKGLGKWLLIHLLKSACDRNLTHATLEVRQSNQAAQALYHKFGFKVAGERRNYYSDGENALVLWRSDLQSLAFTKILKTEASILVQRLQQAHWQLADMFNLASNHQA